MTLTGSEAFLHVAFLQGTSLSPGERCGEFSGMEVPTHAESKKKYFQYFLKMHEKHRLWGQYLLKHREREGISLLEAETGFHGRAWAWLMLSCFIV